MTGTGAKFMLRMTGTVQVKHVPFSLITWLCLFINACICHQYIPRQILVALLVPLLKSRGKDPTTFSDYRPTVIATVLSKVEEKVVLHHLEAYLYTLSFQSQEGTWTLKNIIHYISRGSPVYLCFLDASKVFDRVNY